MPSFPFQFPQVFGPSGAVAVGFDTAGNIINDVAVEVGLSAADDAFASTDSNFIQLRTLLKTVGRNLRRRKQWSHLQYAYTFITVQGQSRYPKPLDFGSFISQSAWNRTNRLPMGGPLSPQDYEYFKSRLLGVVFSVLFRDIQGQFQVYPDVNTPGNFVISYEYMSGFWAVPANTPDVLGSWQVSTPYDLNDNIVHGGGIYTCSLAGTSGTHGPTGGGSGIVDGSCTWDFAGVSGADATANSADVVLFDPQLVTRALKLAFLLAKGFDATSAQAEYEIALEDVTGDDSASSILSLSGARGEPLLSARNIPETGYGA